MGAVKFSHAIGRLPYASEVFGTYRPMVGWASKRKKDRLRVAQQQALTGFVGQAIGLYRTGNVYSGPPSARLIDKTAIGSRSETAILRSSIGDGGTFFLPAVQRFLAEQRGTTSPPPSADEWRDLLTREAITNLYGNEDLGVLHSWKVWRDRQWDGLAEKVERRPGESAASFEEREASAEAQRYRVSHSVLDRESKIGAILADLAAMGAGHLLNSLFYAQQDGEPSAEQLVKDQQSRLEDPFREFDPTNELNGVTVSPIGIVHFFRQYFFDLDTFLGPAVGHVWLSPGATVELVESSTRRALVERTEERETQTSSQTETGQRGQDEFSDAVHTENREDSKLGFSATANQSWPTGSATATASLNLDRTQESAREFTQKRMREQSEKISTELRTSFRTTFKTVTETTDVSSKRYVLNNPSPTHLQNYEMRRKMRHVGVQVQDIGSYLCWETFVDDPGASLGLADLVHIAKPPDVTPQPNPATIPIPERKAGIGFDVKVQWPGPDDRVDPSTPEGIALGRRQMGIDVPDGYQFEMPVGFLFQLQCTAATGEGEGFRSYQYLARYAGGQDLDIILAWGPGGLEWDHAVELDLHGTVALVVTQQRRADIEAQNKAIIAAAEAAATDARKRAEEAAFYAAAQERIELASSIRPRKFEDLREEERTVVYRALIRELMASDAKTKADNYDTVGNKLRHVYATVLNAIFDIDKMLYFVAPEWWRPRFEASHLQVGSHPNGGQTAPFGPDKVVHWSGGPARTSNYYITSKSEPARLGSSLGWMLQLDGDDMRNRFLNAPWVRAVIPIRPGKEEAALEWLGKAGVEGSEGFQATYAAQPGEAEEIRKGLAATENKAADPPTIGDAIRYLCLAVAAKHGEGTRERLFPDRSGVDDGDKVWATPIDKVYEHGFYPLERSFRASPVEPPTDGASHNYQIMAEWTEVLPTDQIVPVVVDYDPITGRQKDPEPPKP